MIGDNVCSAILVVDACKDVLGSNEINVDSVIVVDSLFNVTVVEKAFLFSVADIVECILEILMCDMVCSAILVDDACKDVLGSNEINVDTVIVVDCLFVVFVVEMAFLSSVSDIVECFSEIIVIGNVSFAIVVDEAGKDVSDSNEMIVDTVLVVDNIFVGFVEEIAFIFSVAVIVECISEILIGDNVCSAILVDDACNEVLCSDEIIVETVFVVDSLIVVLVVEIVFIFSLADIVECFSEILVFGNVSSAIVVDEAWKDVSDSNEIIVDTVFVVDSLIVVLVVEMAFIFSVTGIVECISVIWVSDNVCAAILVDEACKDVSDSNEMIVENFIVVEIILFVFVEEMAFLFSVADIVECFSEILVIVNVSSAIVVDEASKDVFDSNKMIVDTVLVVDSIFVVFILVMAFILSVAVIVECISEIWMSDNVCSAFLVEMFGNTVFDVDII